MTLLPVVSAHALDERPPERRWLIEGLWSARAVGIAGGEPKCCKSFLALDLAVSVASGAPCLGRFRVAEQGRALVFAAEDALHVVRERLVGICAARGVGFDESLDVQVITADALRIDLPEDRLRLHDTVAELRPRVLVLDPFVRLHRGDENAAGEVAPMLAYLRELQRRFDTAVLLVHHARKGATHARAGQALRGSSEFHAWGDSNLYLRRRGPELLLSIEHRAAPSQTDLRVELHDGPGLALRVVGDAGPDTPALPDPKAQPGSRGRARLEPAERVLAVLESADEPVTGAALREACSMKSSILWSALTGLVAAGRVERTPEGYQLAAP